MRTSKWNNMGNWFYYVALLMMILWGISFLGCHDYGLVHILLLISLVAALYGRILRKKEYDH